MVIDLYLVEWVTFPKYRSKVAFVIELYISKNCHRHYYRPVCMNSSMDELGSIKVK